MAPKPREIINILCKKFRDLVSGPPERHRLGYLCLKRVVYWGMFEVLNSLALLIFFSGKILLSLLLPRQNRLRNEVEEALDMDLLKQEAEHGALDVPHLSNYILNLMALLCAPARDEAVRKLKSITDPVQLLR